MVQMTKLILADDLVLPLDTVTQAVAILAKRRAGKSYLARRFAEQLHAARQQIVIIDPKGDWWGARSAADGKSPGMPIVILGGDHGDLPLEADSGTIVARLVVEERVSVLLDLSLLRKHEVATFMAVFLEDLYRLKARAEYRTPLMLFVDEADAVAPQKPQPNEMRMLGAINDVVRRGGQRGLGCCVITQRSAVLSKDVLTQVQVLITLRTMSPQDLAAIKAWVDVHGTVEQQKVLMASLPSLPIGDAWFWSPGWPTDEGIFQRSHVLPITTFDSGATPKAGETVATPKRLADVDLESVRKQMAESLERAKENDPKALKEEVKRLRAQLAEGGAVDTIDRKLVELEMARLTQARKDQSEAVFSSIGTVMDIEETCRKLHVELDSIKSSLDNERTHRTINRPDLVQSSPPAVLPESIQPKPKETLKAKSERIQRVNAERGSIPPGEWETLKVISSTKGGANVNLIVLATGYRKGSIKSYTNRLITRGLIRRENGIFFSTGAGLLVAPPSKLPKGDALIDHYRRTLPAGEGQVLGALRRLHPSHLDLAAVTMACEGLAMGSVKSYLNRLATRGLVMRQAGNNWLSREFGL